MHIRTFTRFMGYTLACLLAGGTGATAQGTSKNLIRNPGLEESPADNGLPTGWIFVAGGADATYTPTITEGGHTGAKSLRIEGKGGWAIVRTTQVDIEPGKIYHVRGWVKFEGGAGRAVLKFDYLDENSNFVASAQFHGVTASQPGWQLVTVTATPSNYPKAKRIAASLVLEREGKAWFDDLEMIATDGEQQSNFLVNGNAEDTVGDRPGGWFLVDQVGPATLVSSTDTPKEGERCIALRGKAATLSVSMPGVKLDPAMNYVVSGFLRARKGTAALRLKYMANSKSLGTTVSEPVKEGTWQQRTLPVDREKYPDVTDIYVYGDATGPDIEANFDDFRISPASAPTVATAPEKPAAAEVLPKQTPTAVGANTITMRTLANWEKWPVHAIGITKEKRTDGKGNCGRLNVGHSFARLTRIPADWSHATEISLWLRSKKPTHEKVSVLLPANNTATPGTDRYAITFPVDWVGWKHFQWKREDFQPKGKPTGWNHIDNITLAGERWGKPGAAVLWIDDVTLTEKSVSLESGTGQ